MELSLLLIFWYGVLHAFGPDHLTAIADFSIGKNRQKTLAVTILFAIGHGLSLFIFAKVLESVEISPALLAYGDVISASVILGMGVFFLFMVFTKRIQLKTHMHEGKEHAHIWFGKNHEHTEQIPVDTSSSFGLGLLMGVGGVRGMLITLGALQHGSVNFSMVGAFTAGVMLIFILFGFVMLFVNQRFLGNLSSVRRAFGVMGVISLIVGTNILVG